MNARLTDEGCILLEDIDDFSMMLLRELPSTASSTDKRAEERLYQSPTQGEDDEIDSEWSDTMEPELRELFADAIDMVVEDLAAMKDGDGDEGPQILIPANHVDPWMHTLNRARLVLGEIWDITDEEMNDRFDKALDDAERTMAILKVDLYGAMLEFFVRVKLED
jgi:hypothetical protein